MSAEKYEYQAMLKSVMNFRDAGDSDPAGGTGLRKGLIYRSGSLDRIKREDIRRLQQLGIKAIVDLRAPAEYSKRKVVIPGINVFSMPLDFEHVTRERLKPLIMSGNQEEAVQKVITELYREILDAAIPIYREIVEMILDGGHTPMLIHCRAGKDRTGIICALLQMAAGSSEDSIIRNFMKSNDVIVPYYRKRLWIRKILSLGFFPADAILDAITLRGENIREVIKRVRVHYGGIAGYLSVSGFDMSKFMLLKGKLNNI